MVEEKAPKKSKSKEEQVQNSKHLKSKDEESKKERKKDKKENKKEKKDKKKHKDKKNKEEAKREDSVEDLMKNVDDEVPHSSLVQVEAAEQPANVSPSLVSSFNVSHLFQMFLQQYIYLFKKLHFGFYNDL